MIPDYQSLMLPLPRLTEDGREYRMADVVGPLATRQIGEHLVVAELGRGG
jgi:hypothetical protein